MAEDKTILIVDDAPENVTILAELLNNYSLKVATNGEKALKIVFSGKKIDLILLDVIMPGLNGFEVAQKIKENPETAQIPIIFVTGQSDVHSFVKGFDLGAEEYITKPFNPESVLSVIRQTIAKLEQAE